MEFNPPKETQTIDLDEVAQHQIPVKETETQENSADKVSVGEAENAEKDSADNSDEGNITEGVKEEVIEAEVEAVQEIERIVSEPKAE